LFNLELSNQHPHSMRRVSAERSFANSRPELYHIMRSAEDFDLFYKSPDPWHISRAGFRDKILRHRLLELVRGRSVLELGCGEGHLTQVVFGQARSVTGIDISDVAIDRARSRKISNAKFVRSDFLQVSFEGYDVITAIECLYYLSHAEQNDFFVKIAHEHAGKTFVLSTPIIGKSQFRRYFTHDDLMAAFRRHGMVVESFYNLNVYRHGALRTALAAMVRVVPSFLDLIPERFIYQRLYKIRMM
jgi:2-polyprenyl-3-methyl-5-hydroxy-6-metoxy-1,4-benzoquinol methylase